MKEYRIDLKVKNNIILYKIEQAGYKTVAEFCRINNIPNDNSTLCSIINLKESPLNCRGEFKQTVKKVAEKLNCAPLDLFSDDQLHTVLKTNKKSIQVSEAEVKFVIEYHVNTVKSLEDMVFEDERNKCINEVMDSLNDKEKMVIYKRNDGYTYKDIGKEMNVSIERARQIEAKAIRKLRHPSRSEKLKEFYEG